ncbi:hypothetical protein BHM03_00024152 [Ensete ventricosum]|nr:hypothetical protein BHM03_00024152 [Ensete ventricosum]
MHASKTGFTSELGEVEVEARGAEAPVVGVPVGGLKVAGGLESGGVPEAAAEICDEREARPQSGDLGHEGGVLVDGAQSVVDRIIHPLDAPRRPVDAHPLLRRHRRRPAQRATKRGFRPEFSRL